MVAAYNFGSVYTMNYKKIVRLLSQNIKLNRLSGKENYTPHWHFQREMVSNVEKCLTFPHANNKCAYQATHPCSLISVFVIKLSGKYNTESYFMQNVNVNILTSLCS